MNCQEARPLLAAHVDRELSVPESVAMDRHLAQCADCRREFDEQASLSATVKQHAAYFDAPNHLEHRIRAALPREPAPPRVRGPGRWRWFDIGAAMASLCAIVVSVGLFMATPSADDRLAEEVLSSHVRSLMSNRVADVASSDQHTVKPWFAGKLDFSPTVTDFADQGYPLVGGRLDYVDQRPVAALVYRHRQHLINLYVWPASGGKQTSPQTVTLQGYHMVHWTDEAMTHWAISDLAAPELESLVRILQDRSRQPAKG